jgi:hypothetical protein
MREIPVWVTLLLTVASGADSARAAAPASLDQLDREHLLMMMGSGLETWRMDTAARCRFPPAGSRDARGDRVLLPRRLLDQCLEGPPDYRGSGLEGVLRRQFTRL